MKVTQQDSLRFHEKDRAGKFEIRPTKPLVTQQDLSLAYSPGVAYPCLEIKKNPQDSYKYTNRGNMVAVISNGTAVLGLGKIGALASKPVMEGKAVLFKKFADIDAVDIELETTDIDAFVNAVKIMEPSFGGINLEDIKAPECFIIEQKLREAMHVPVFHDDQHGTAIVVVAGLINALHLSGKKAQEVRLVINGAGAASLACAELVKSIGVQQQNIIICDSRGVIYKGRKAGMNTWKAAHANHTTLRTLGEAMEGADVFFGLSVEGALTQDMVKSMADAPIIFAMANPNPEISPTLVDAVRNDAIVATGRSDYPNQVNNVLGFPFIFRGALDVRATAINNEMKIAAAKAIADLARQDVPEEIAKAYGVNSVSFGKKYIIPMPFDYRLISIISPAVAKAAMDTGVALKPIENLQRYENHLKSRLDPTATTMQAIFDRIKMTPKRVIFPNANDERVLRAAKAFQKAGYGIPVLVGEQKFIKHKMVKMGIQAPMEICSPSNTENIDAYSTLLYKKMWRKGFLQRDIAKLLKTDPNIFAIAKLLCGEVDAMVTGTTLTYAKNFNIINKFIPAMKNRNPIGVMMIVAKGHTVFIADSVCHSRPDSTQLANIAQMTAGLAKRLGHKPRVAFLSFSNFGDPECGTHYNIVNAVKILDERHAEFEYEGEMNATIALNYTMQKTLFPNTSLSGPANVLIMPGLSSAHIATRLMQELGDGTVIGPILLGYNYPIQITQVTATANDIVNLAALVAYDSIIRGKDHKTLRSQP